ncbi:MAG: hypothetical protein Kow0092_33340 [Deferrisomatales bacterium]
MCPSGARLWFRRGAWAGAVALILWWTLLPFAGDLSPGALAAALADIQWIPFVERGRAPLWSDVVANVALFLPFGLAGWRNLEGVRGRLVVLLGLAVVLSLAVETVQLALPARRTSATDLVTDACGTLAGAAAGRLWELEGRRAVREWVEGLLGGEGDKVRVAAFALCLLAWALVPGSAADNPVWRQLQGFSASFRKFPGWLPWAAGSAHAVVLGALFGFLAGRSAGLERREQAAVGAAAAALLGLVLEGVQLWSPSRRPEIFQALAFGLGGAGGAGLAATSAPASLAVFFTAFGAALLALPGGDSPVAPTVVAMLVGCLLAGWSELSSP